MIVMNARWECLEIQERLEKLSKEQFTALSNEMDQFLNMCEEFDIKFTSLQTLIVARNIVRDGKNE